MTFKSAPLAESPATRPIKGAPAPGRMPLTTAERKLADTRAGLIKARDRAERAAEEVAEARQAAEDLRWLAGSNAGKKVRIPAPVIVAVSIVAIAAFIAVSYDVGQSRQRSSLPSMAAHGAGIPKSVSSTAAAPPIPPPALPVKTANPSPDVQMIEALRRLQDGFNSFPGELPLDVVREINLKHPGEPIACPLGWNDRGAALFVSNGKDQAIPDSLLTALNRCATKLEELSAERRSAEAR